MRFIQPSASWRSFEKPAIFRFARSDLTRSRVHRDTNLLYKVIDASSGRRSTALVTNIDFQTLGEYLGDPPLAMAFLDRIVDGAIILKVSGRSYLSPARKKKSSAAK